MQDRWPRFFVLLTLGHALALGQTTSVALLPASQHIGIDSSGKARVTLESVQALHAYTIRVEFNPEVVTCGGVTGLLFFGPSSVLFAKIDTLQGFVQVDEALLGAGGQSGSGDLFELNFVGAGNGTTQLQFGNADLRNAGNERLAVRTLDAEMQVGLVSGVGGSGADGGGLMDIANFPNPFNLSTAIVVRGVANGPANMRIYSILGEEVFHKEIVSNRDVSEIVVWDARMSSAKIVPSGVYVVKVEAGAFAVARKIMLVK
jgi:hypothetical protein